MKIPNLQYKGQKSSKKKFFSKKNIVILIIVVLIGLTIYRISSKTQAVKQGKAERSTTVLVREAKKETFKRYLDLYGELRAENEVEITSPVTGKVLALPRLEGQNVNKGQTILTVDRFEVGSRFAAATVQSPIKGTITRVFVNKGEDVTIGKVVAVVGNPNVMEATIKVPESSVPEVKVGQDVFFQSRSIANQIFKGKITRRDLSLDPISRALTVRAVISNTGSLFSGIYAESYIFVEENTNVYVVPDTAITKTKDGLDAIYVSVDDKAELKPVTIAIRYRDQIGISEGIEDGDLLVVFGREYLSPGAPIRPIPETRRTTNRQLIETAAVTNR